jgi:hypothetical protein
MNIEELIQSKRFVKGGVQFGTPSEYINPFIDIAEAKFPDITVRTSGKVENAEDTGESNISYSRGLVEMQGLEVNGIRQKFGFLYALDLQKPIYKIYAGTEVVACTNLCVFRADELFTGFILDGMSKGITFAKQIISNYERIFQEYMELQLSLEANIVKTKDVLGPLLQYSIKNPYLGTTPIVYAAKELQDSSSRYFAKDGECSMWNVYNSVTQSISSKSDIADKASKTLILSQFKEFNIN